MFFRFVTSGEIRRRSEFFEPFVLGLTNATVEQVCFFFFFGILCAHDHLQPFHSLKETYAAIN